MKITVKKMVLMAISAALFVVLDRFSINLDPIKITLSGIPLIYISIKYGPKEGLIVGLIGAFIGQLLGYGITITTILWIIPAGLRGLVVGIFGNIFNFKDNKVSIVLAIFASSIVVTIANTCVMAVDSLIYHYYSDAYIFGSFLYRFGLSMLTAVIYSVIFISLIRIIKIEKDPKKAKEEPQPEIEQ